ncbi:restriction endonuclease subunit S [Micromonospora harpali]|uniref:Restriction endonuclease subunit S n=1 Tax=Micromonospora harpali TaxID=1490225 RepID=A0ABW1HLY6_9ACTN
MRTIAWLGEVRFPVASARQGFEIVLGKMLQPEATSSIDIKVPYLRSASVQWSDVDTDDVKLMWASPREVSEFAVKSGDLLVCEGGDVGRAGLFTGPPGLIIQNSLHRVRPRGGNDVRFFRYALMALHGSSYLDVLCNKATIGHLTGEKLKALEVPLPSPEEQRRIADFLDEQTVLIDRVIALRQRQTELEVERFEELRESVVEGDKRALRPPLINLIEQTRPINYGVLMPGPRVEDGIPLVEAGDVMRGPICLTRLRLTEPRIEAEFKRSRLREGDLVMAIRGSVGGVQIVPGGAGVLNVTRDAARISPNPTIAVSAYVRHALSTRRAQDWLRIRITGSAVTGINIGDLRKAPVVMTDLKAQRERARELDEAEGYLADFKQFMLRGRSLLIERKQALIAAAVTGRIDVTTARRAKAQ